MSLLLDRSEASEEGSIVARRVTPELSGTRVPVRLRVTGVFATGATFSRACLYRRDLQSTSTGGVQARFRRLAEEWRRESAFLSSVAAMSSLRSYQRIIGLGPAVVPVLLRELEREPGHWFWALEAITEEDPVPPEVRGDLRRMADAWVRWGKASGRIS